MLVDEACLVEMGVGRAEAAHIARRASEVGRCRAGMVLVGLEFTEFEGGHFTCARVFENSGDRLIVGGGYALWRGEVMPKATGRVLLVGEPDFLKVQ